jgi:hypothetical protein
LAEYSQFEDIVVADHDLDAAQAMVDEVGDARLNALKFDADDEDVMRRTIPAFDVVVNALPSKYDLPISTVCVGIGVNGLDVSSEDSQLALHERALEKDMISSRVWEPHRRLEYDGRRVQPSSCMCSTKSTSIAPFSALWRRRRADREWTGERPRRAAAGESLARRPVL